MAYPKKVKGENTNADNMTAAPGAPRVASAAAPQVMGASGGAPRISREPPVGGDAKVSAPTISQRQFFPELPGGGGYKTASPSAPTLPLGEAQKYLGDLANTIKSQFDERAKTADPGSRFWQAYQQYPEAMATMVARRVWTDQMLASGDVARWLKFLRR